jgi:hypothetical protein
VLWKMEGCLEAWKQVTGREVKRRDGDLRFERHRAASGSARSQAKEKRTTASAKEPKSGNLSGDVDGGKWYLVVMRRMTGSLL